MLSNKNIAVQTYTFTSALAAGLLLFSACMSNESVRSDTSLGQNDVENDSQSIPQDPTHDSDIAQAQHKLRVRFAFDPHQERLDNFGQPAQIPSGHATQTPNMHTFSAHFIELVPDARTPYGEGVRIYSGHEVGANNPNPYGFERAIDFSQAILVEQDEIFTEVSISEIEPATYHYVRVSASYQNYSVVFDLQEVPFVGMLPQQSGRLASILGYNTHIGTLLVGAQNVEVDDFKLQGFWAFETQFPQPYASYNQIYTGQAPAAATTVVNALPQSPIPQGSCVVVGKFIEPLTVDAQNDLNVDLYLSFSTNQSFEWQDRNGNGKWDLSATDPSNNEPVVDMGLRGLVARAVSDPASAVE